MRSPRRSVPPVEPVAADIWSIPVPMPDPLVYTNVFALAGPDGLTLVDAGWRGPDGIAPLARGLESFGATLQDVDGVFLTHSHMDHYGLLDEIRQASGAWTAMHAADTDEAVTRALRAPALADAWLAELGVDPAERVTMLETLRSIGTQIAPPQANRLLADGELVDAGGLELRVLHTPGHSPGHVCLVCESRGVVFTGDHVLSRTTPNVSVRPPVTGSPLDDYLASLELMLDLEGMTALPGHEERVDVALRAAEILAHHEAQLEQAHALVASGRETVTQIAAAMEWSTPWERLGTVDVFLALGETLAHLIALERRGRLSCTTAPVQRWRLPAGAGTSA